MYGHGKCLGTIYRVSIGKVDTLHFLHFCFLREDFLFWLILPQLLLFAESSTTLIKLNYRITLTVMNTSLEHLLKCESWSFAEAWFFMSPLQKHIVDMAQ